MSRFLPSWLIPTLFSSIAVTRPEQPLQRSSVPFSRSAHQSPTPRISQEVHHVEEITHFSRSSSPDYYDEDEEEEVIANQLNHYFNDNMASRLVQHRQPESLFSELSTMAHDENNHENEYETIVPEGEPDPTPCYACAIHDMRVVFLDLGYVPRPPGCTCRDIDEPMPPPYDLEIAAVIGSIQVDPIRRLAPLRHTGEVQRTGSPVAEQLGPWYQRAIAAGGIPLRTTSTPTPTNSSRGSHFGVPSVPTTASSISPYAQSPTGANVQNRRRSARERLEAQMVQAAEANLRVSRGEAFYHQQLPQQQRRASWPNRMRHRLREFFRRRSTGYPVEPAEPVKGVVRDQFLPAGMVPPAGPAKPVLRERTYWQRAWARESGGISLGRFLDDPEETDLVRFWE
ncbi:hypothetical protein MMC25_008132 [Agyrium rufum]|nr:hypothetical protein [Agyrium rufum]